MGLRRYRSIHWTALRALAALVVGLAVVAFVSEGITLIGKATQLGPTEVNPVVENAQRRHAASLENQVLDYQANLAAVAGFSAYILLVTVHSFGLLWRFFGRAPLASLLGGLFIGASSVCGLLVAPMVVKVNEFAFQVANSPSPEKEWLGAGMSFLNQLHVVFVHGWLLFLALGWVSVGLGAVRLWGRYRFSGILLLLGALAIAVSLCTRYSLPGYGQTVAGVLLLLDGLFSLGIVVGLLGSGLLAWFVEGIAHHPTEENGPA